MKRSKLVLVGVAIAIGAATAPSAFAAGSGAIHVPSDFDQSHSDTRATGHYEVQGTGLHIWTTGATSTDKVAEYVATSTPLENVGDPTLEYANTSGAGVPGYQLITDFDGDGTVDGILVGEPVYNGEWWLANGNPSVQAGAPHNGGGYGSPYHGTLDEWRSAFPDAVVRDFGFSLGSGVKGDGIINAINFAGTRYTFAKDVTLANKNECKNGGWATSTMPVFKNQGDCVSSFASAK